ncbi:sodium:calcium antiporter [Piscinibacter sakaiensis]|uniref:sodium:calcium antiporter n=1 Tax=Piscinibacter sakaiensis TaxID=1547922 RepID=UPI003AB0F20C
MISIPDFNQLPLAGNAALFAAAAAVIGVSGWFLAAAANRLADRTGLGEAVAGAIFLGATTSLPGSITSLTAAIDGRAAFAVSNGLGGIAAQTAFIAIADISYRRANLEHAAASLPNIMQGSLLVVMLAMIALAIAAPPFTVAGVHPVSVTLVVGYLVGLKLVHRVHRKPMWTPRSTKETRHDEPEPEAEQQALAPLIGRFAALAVTVGVAGWLIARTGLALAAQTGLSDSAVGGVLTALSTSLPELVTALAAVRQGALTLAVGDIIGGNVFDTLFVAIADIAYRGGSVLHADGLGSITLITSAALLQTGILLVALLHRQQRGLANVGVDSMLMMGIYLGLVLLLFNS